MKNYLYRFICTIEEYGDKALENNVLYPRELEENRHLLDKYIREIYHIIINP